jgi:hypothetical protein
MTNPWFVALTTHLQDCDCNCSLHLYPRPQHIEYAKTKSYATLQKEDPNFVHPSLSKQPSPATALANGVAAEKRAREDDDTDGERDRKRGRPENEEETDEMEIEDEEGRPQGDANGHAGKQSQILEYAVAHAFLAPPPQPVVKHPTAALLCTNLPQEVTDDVLSVLFQQYAY